MLILTTKLYVTRDGRGKMDVNASLAPPNSPSHVIYHLYDTEPYVHLTSGTCPVERQLSGDECRKISDNPGDVFQKVGWNGNGVYHKWTNPSVPSGCFYTYSAEMGFNDVKEETPCSTVYSCLCKTREGNTRFFL